MTRQRIRQIKHKSLGLCIFCTAPAVDATYCARHAARQATYVLQRRRRKLGIPIDAPVRKYTKKPQLL